MNFSRCIENRQQELEYRYMVWAHGSISIIILLSAPLKVSISAVQDDV